MCCGNDAVDEENIRLCCAIGCANCGIYEDFDCFGCSGKVGIFCLNCEICCKPSAPCLPCCCCGPKCECDGMSCVNLQVQVCCLALTAAFPCNEEVPVAVAICGFLIFPEVGCYVKIGELGEKAADHERPPVIVQPAQTHAREHQRRLQVAAAAAAEKGPTTKRQNWKSLR